VPRHYPIPDDDGPVGQLLAATGRHPNRPAHVHVIVTAQGYRPVTTHLFVDDSPYLDSDAVFAVKDSLVIRFETSHDRDLAAAHRLEVPFILADVELVLAPLDATGAGLAVPAEGTWR